MTPPLDTNAFSSGPSPQLWTLFYHQLNKRFLITREKAPSDDFCQSPPSYKLFGGQRDGAQHVYEIGKAETVEELKLFVMVMNSNLAFDQNRDQSATYYGLIQNAFKAHYMNLIIDL